jgi:hypothetical protein
MRNFQGEGASLPIMLHGGTVQHFPPINPPLDPVEVAVMQQCYCVEWLLTKVEKRTIPAGCQLLSTNGYQGETKNQTCLIDRTHCFECNRKENYDSERSRYI